jgi:hypothetical protein
MWDGIRELTKPLVFHPDPRNLFTPRKHDKRFYIRQYPLEESEYNLMPNP